MTAARSRRALLGLSAALAAAGCALRRTPVKAPPVVLPDTQQIDVAATGHLHRIMVATPPAPPPAQGWPVLYVLDGNLLFPLAAQLMRNRFARGPGVPTQGAVVVGLGYAGSQVLDLDARSYDYTPPAPGLVADERSRRIGGADAFLDFIDATVRPLAAGAAHVDAARQTLFGHSYGGLCALHALFTRPGGFRNYVAASPSVWWHGGFILQAQARFLAARRADAPPLRLLVTQGEREAETPADPARAAIARQRRSGEHLRMLLDGLRDAPGLDVRFASFPGADHGSSMVPAAQQALALAIGERA
ncbi:MAG: alpha/beta hydrolase [Lautropia sp.]